MKASLQSTDPPPRWVPDRRRPAARFLKRPAGVRRLLQLLRELPGNFFLYVFRVAPYPAPPGMIAIGRPDRRSPVLVTSNYELTVRRVVRALDGTDCRLLVAPASGINVWCAAGGGHFSIDGIVSILKTSRIADLVDHRRLILPMLCANGINGKEVEKRTGWTASFGPARAEHLPEYLARDCSKTPWMGQVTFRIPERLEMALAMWGSLALRYTFFPLVFFGIVAALGFVGLLAAFSLIVALGCFVLPGKTFVQKTGTVALALSALALGATALRSDLPWLLAAVVVILILGASFLTGTAFPGYSPLWQCAYSKLFFGAPKQELGIDRDDCIDCGVCDEVCPIGCFATTERGAYELVHPSLCASCMACVTNCPTGAIVNTFGGACRPGCVCT